MDLITTALLKEFCNDYNLGMLAQDKQFEYFATHVIMSRFQVDTFDPSDLVLGSGGDTSIDAIGIVANGSLVTEKEQITDLADRNGYLDVTFVFIQAERSSSFASATIGETGFGVEDFFKDKPTLPRSDAITKAAGIMRAIYDRSALFRRGNPSCRIYYVTTGKWQDDKHLEARRSSVATVLTNLGLFRDVEFTPVGADLLQKLYRQSQNSISREFSFVARTVVPEIPGVSEAYLGFLPADEFLHLVKDENDILIKSIFYDNVRDWQDYNDVNEGIRDTVTNDALRPKFVLMNNGITIIAKTLRATGNRFTIEDYQIVNGCQTSHVLYDNRQHLDESVMVPVRVISTQNEEVIAAIIKATNRQTVVKEEQLLALTEFQKKLEEYFKSFDNGKKLYYERRSCQYNNVPGIEKTRIVTRTNLIQAFTAFILEEPHRTTRSSTGVRESVGKAIFADDHRLEPYYTSALALYRLEYLFRNQSIDAKYKPARHHILLGFRMLANPEQPPARNSHQMRRYCEALMETLWDTSASEELFLKAVAAVGDLATGNIDRDTIRTLAFTDSLKRRFRPDPTTQP